MFSFCLFIYFVLFLLDVCVTCVSCFYVDMFLGKLYWFVGGLKWDESDRRDEETTLQHLYVFVVRQRNEN